MAVSFLAAFCYLAFTVRYHSEAEWQNTKVLVSILAIDKTALIATTDQ
ncbi:hypothetical protein ACTVOX_02120 [Serratia marcescens]